MLTLCHRKMYSMIRGLNGPFPEILTPGANATWGPWGKIGLFQAVCFFSIVNVSEKIFRWKFKQFEGKCLSFLTSHPFGLTSPSGGQKFHPRTHKISPAFRRELQNFSIFFRIFKNKQCPAERLATRSQRKYNYQKYQKKQIIFLVKILKSAI